MKFILIIVFIISMTETKTMRAFWAELSSYAQKSCLNLTDYNSEFKSELQSILCGRSIQFSEHYFEIKRLGLIHIFVVSGAHFATLQILFSLIFTSVHRVFPRRRRSFFLWCESFLLVIFLFATGLQAPALRSFFQGFWRAFAPWIPSPTLILAVGLLCFAWIDSNQVLSLQLSWYCALVLALPGLNGASGFFIKSLFLFLGCTYFLCSLGVSSLMCVLSNLILAPIISFGLFPLSILAAILPSSLVLFEKLMTFFYFISDEISADFYLQSLGGSPPTPQHWVFLGVFHFALHMQHQLSLRAAHAQS